MNQRKRDREQDELNRRLKEAQISQMQQPPRRKAEIVDAGDRSVLIDTETGEIIKEIPRVPDGYRRTQEAQKLMEISGGLAYKDSTAQEKQQRTDLIELALSMIQGQPSFGDIQKEATGPGGFRQHYPGGVVFPPSPGTPTRPVSEATPTGEASMAGMAAPTRPEGKASLTPIIKAFSEIAGRERPQEAPKAPRQEAPKAPTQEAPTQKSTRQKPIKIKAASKKPPKPKEYPNAIWNEEYKMWTIVQNGRLKGIK